MGQLCSFFPTAGRVEGALSSCWAAPGLGTGWGANKHKFWQSALLLLRGPTYHGLNQKGGQAAQSTCRARGHGAAGATPAMCVHAHLPQGWSCDCSEHPAAPGGFPQLRSKICRLAE